MIFTSRVPVLRPGARGGCWWRSERSFRTCFLLPIHQLDSFNMMFSTELPKLLSKFIVTTISRMTRCPSATRNWTLEYRSGSKQITLFSIALASSIQIFQSYNCAFEPSVFAWDSIFFLGPYFLVWHRQQHAFSTKSDWYAHVSLRYLIHQYRSVSTFYVFVLELRVVDTRSRSEDICYVDTHRIFKFSPYDYAQLGRIGLLKFGVFIGVKCPSSFHHTTAGASLKQPWQRQTTSMRCRV